MSWHNYLLSNLYSSVITFEKLQRKWRILKWLKFEASPVMLCPFLNSPREPSTKTECIAVFLEPEIAYNALFRFSVGEVPDSWQLRFLRAGWNRIGYLICTPSSLALSLPRGALFWPRKACLCPARVGRQQMIRDELRSAKQCSRSKVVKFSLKSLRTLGNNFLEAGSVASVPWRSNFSDHSFDLLLSRSDAFRITLIFRTWSWIQHSCMRFRFSLHFPAVLSNETAVLECGGAGSPCRSFPYRLDEDGGHRGPNVP